MTPALSNHAVKVAEPIDEKAFASSHPQINVDSHLHVFKAGLSQAGARYTPGYDAPLDAWQTRARGVGVTHGVLVQTSFMGTDNRWLLAHLARHPALLRGIAVVCPEAGLPLLAGLHAQGVRGIRLNLAGQPHGLAGWRGASTLWDTVLQLGWHVELHTDTGGLPPVLAALPLALPLVLDHFAKPARVSAHDDSVAAIGQRLQRGGHAVHVKLSAAYRLATGVDPVALARLWQGELGAGALLWGSDWPHTNHESHKPYAALHGDLDQWLGGDVEAVHAARCANPVRLYGFDASERR